KLAAVRLAGLVGGAAPPNERVRGAVHDQRRQHAPRGGKRRAHLVAGVRARATQLVGEHALPRDPHDAPPLFRWAGAGRIGVLRAVTAAPLGGRTGGLRAPVFVVTAPGLASVASRRHVARADRRWSPPRLAKALLEEALGDLEARVDSDEVHQ